VGGGGRRHHGRSLEEHPRTRPSGHIVFSGNVSLENEGGFASIQNHFAPIDVSSYTHAVIRLKGDGKKFFYILEAEKNARHYYVAEFLTSGEWQEIKFPMGRGLGFFAGFPMR